MNSAERLKNLREHYQLSQNDVAKILKVSPALTVHTNEVNVLLVLKSYLRLPIYTTPQRTTCFVAIATMMMPCLSLLMD